MRVVGIVVPFIPLGCGYPGKIRFNEPQGEMGTGDMCRVPLAAVRHGIARQSSGTGPSGCCRRVRGYGARGVSIQACVTLYYLCVMLYSEF